MMLHRLALIALIVLPSTALAQPGNDVVDEDSPPVSSASEPPRGRLSHINGVPIKVGNHNEYYYEFKRWNISSNPIGWMVGSYGLSVSYAASDHIAVRGDVNLYSPVGDDGSGFELGAGMPIYFRRAYQGPFLEPGVIIRHIEYGYDDYGSTTMGPQVLAGWHWTWDSGLNIAFALGAGRNFSKCSQSCDDYYYEQEEEEPFVNGYLRFGYAF